MLCRLQRARGRVTIAKGDVWCRQADGGTRKEDPFGRIEIRDLAQSIGFIRARGYARVSAVYQAHGSDPTSTVANEISLPEQIDAIRRFCAEKGYTYTGCHWDSSRGRLPTVRGSSNCANLQWPTSLTCWSSGALTGCAAV